MRRYLTLGLVIAVACAGVPRWARADIVTDWFGKADALGDGNPNWHSLAVMHMAVHDAVNAARPTYARWFPAAPGEPPGAGAMPEAAVAAAAAGVLVELHPDRQDDVNALYEAEIAAMPPGAARDAGVALGRAVAASTLAHRRDDGFNVVHRFRGSDVDGRWRPVPPNNATSGTTETRPFLFDSTGSFAGTEPPEPGSPRYLADVAEVRRVGAVDPPDRLDGQSDAALFWAYQSGQRGMMIYLAERLAAQPLPGGLPEHARRMSQMATAMADAAIITWAEKEQFSYWRPITAIRSGTFGVVADPDWTPFVETPPHPEYPSGHSSDCFTGAGFLRAVFGSDGGRFVYVAQSALPNEDTHAEASRVTDPNAPPQPVGLRPIAREFPSAEAAAQECANSRIWAGVHFRSANEQSHRIADAIVARAVAAVPPLGR